MAGVLMNRLNRMLCPLLAAGAYALSAQAAEWRVVSKSEGSTVEIDTAGQIRAELGRKVVWARLTLSPAQAQKAGYTMVKALNRYDCQGMRFVTVKRVYFDADNNIVREDAPANEREISLVPGTVDERLFRQVCSPTQMAELLKLAQDASRAAQGDSDKSVVSANDRDVAKVQTVADHTIEKVERKADKAAKSDDSESDTAKPKEKVAEKATSSGRKKFIQMDDLRAAAAESQREMGDAPVKPSSAEASKEKLSRNSEKMSAEKMSDKPSKESSKESAKDSVKDSAKESAKDTAKGKSLELAKDPEKMPGKGEKLVNRRANAEEVNDALKEVGKAPTKPKAEVETPRAPAMREFPEMPRRAAKLVVPKAAVVKPTKPAVVAAYVPPAPPSAEQAAAEHAASLAAHGGEGRWSYDGEFGPANWGRLKPEWSACAIGKRQSPIDIRDGIKVDLPAIKFNYRTTAFTVVDNGHTVQVNVGEGSNITVNGRDYQLVQFHFHKPAEERINGRVYDMVLHLVHKDYDGRLAEIAVPLEVLPTAVEHAGIQSVWNNLPLEKGSGMSAETLLDLNGLLPLNKNYFTYMGSLTTPPCTEGVLWIVMKTPLVVTADQVAVFSRLYRNNARPVQAANERLIKESR